MAYIRPAEPRDAADWLRMRLALWPDEPDAHREDVRQFFAGTLHEPLAVLLAIDDNGHAVGFAELSIRNVVDSCSSDHVAYLEGWYVDPAVRRHGVGRALIEAAEAWARAQGCTEFGSDAHIDNEVSHRAHTALGFAETSRVVNFRKDVPRVADA